MSLTEFPALGDDIQCPIYRTQEGTGVGFILSGDIKSGTVVR